MQLSSRITNFYLFPEQNILALNSDILATLSAWRRQKVNFNQNFLQVVEQVSKIYDMTVAQQKERQMKAEGLTNDMATSGSDGYLRFP